MAMVSPVSAVVANLYMDFFEELSMQDNLQKEVDHLARVLRLSRELHPQCLYPAHTGNSRREQPRGGTGEGTSGADTLRGWDE